MRRNKEVKLTKKHKKKEMDNGPHPGSKEFDVLVAKGYIMVDKKIDKDTRWIN